MESSFIVNVEHFLFCCTYGFSLRSNAVSKLFVCGFSWCYGCSALEPYTDCELKSERILYAVRMNNKIKEHGSPDLNSGTVLGKQYTYASIFFTDFFVFRAFIFHPFLTIDGYLCSVPTSVDCLDKKFLFSVKFAATSLPFDFTLADVVLFKDPFEIRWRLKVRKKVRCILRRMWKNEELKLKR